MGSVDRSVQPQSQPDSQHAQNNGHFALADQNAGSSVGASMSSRLAVSESNGTNITAVMSSMTNSTQGEDILTIKDRLDEEGVIGSSSDSNGLYIVSDNIKKSVLKGNRKRVYLAESTDRSEKSEKDSSSPNSPFSSSQMMLPKNVKKKDGVKKHVNWNGISPIHKPSPHHDIQLPPEPKCFPICRWFLILIGMMMLVTVLFIMGQLLLDWGNGRAGGPTLKTTESRISENSTTESLLLSSINSTLQSDVSSYTTPLPNQTNN